MNILFVCHRFPYPPNRGGKIRPFQMIKHLSQNHRVVVASLAHSHEELEQGKDLSQHCSEVLAEVLPSSVRWVKAAGALPSSLPSSACYFHSGRLQKRINEISRSIRFDAAIVHCAFVAGYVRNLRIPFRMMDFGDLDSRKWADYAQNYSFPLSLGYALEAAKLGWVERRLAREFDYCTVTANGELESYRELAAATACTVIPNGVDSEYFRCAGKVERDPRRIVFVGRMDYAPNVLGILEFAAKVFPLVRQQVPDAQLRIVGSNPTAKVLALRRTPGITVTGYVPDVRPELEAAGVAVAPLSIARGTQNKVLECMAMGLPVVASPKAAKGVQAVPGEHLLVGSNPEEFAGHIIGLISSEPLRRSLAAAGRTHIVRAHSWPESMKLLDAILDQHVAQPLAAMTQ